MEELIQALMTEHQAELLATETLMSDTRRALLKQAVDRLAAGGIETAALDARLLFQAASGLRHEDIVAEPDLIVPPDAAARFCVFIATPPQI